MSEFSVQTEGLIKAASYFTGQASNLDKSVDAKLRGLVIG